MPSGYTSIILDGGTTRQFMLGCARAFGALIHMRDDPSEKEIPEEIPLSTHHRDALCEAHDELARIKIMKPEEMKVLCEEANVSARESWEKRVAGASHQRLLYTRVLDEVKVWAPPTPEHENFKEFMVGQITESIKFDCSYEENSEPPESMTPEEWHAESLKSAEWDISYHQKNWAEEVARNAERNAWVNALRDALPEDQGQGLGSDSSSLG
jgi:hypothetical protein